MSRVIKHGAQMALAALVFALVPLGEGHAGQKEWSSGQKAPEQRRGGVRRGPSLEALQSAQSHVRAMSEIVERLIDEVTQCDEKDHAPGENGGNQSGSSPSWDAQRSSSSYGATRGGQPGNDLLSQLLKLQSDLAALSDQINEAVRAYCSNKYLQRVSEACAAAVRLERDIRAGQDLAARSSGDVTADDFQELLNEVTAVQSDLMCETRLHPCDRASSWQR